MGIEQAWWYKKWNKERICGITHGRLRPGRNKNGVPYAIELPCGHSFYTNALLEWMSVSGDMLYSPCPCCRKDFTLQELLDKSFRIVSSEVVDSGGDGADE